MPAGLKYHALEICIAIFLGYSSALAHNLDSLDVLDLNYIGIPAQIPLSKDKKLPHDTQILVNEIKDGLVTKFFMAAALVEQSPKIHSQSKEISEICTDDIKRFISDLRSPKLANGATYAYQMLDASSKIPSGVLQGRWFWPGAFEQCVETASPFNQNGTGSTQITGRYFSVALYINGKPVIFAMGRIKCSEGKFFLLVEDNHPNSIDEALSYLESIFHALTNVTIILTAVDVEAAVPQVYSAGAKVALAVCGMLALLVLIGTVLDLHSPGIPCNEKQDHFAQESTVTLDKDTKHLLNTLKSGSINAQVMIKVRWIFSIFKCFSIISNTKKLLDTKTAVGPLACLNGIRVLSMWWVIQGHTFGFGSFCDNVLDASKIVAGFTFQPIANGTFSVDSFFFLSGLLVIYLTLQSWTERGRVNWVYFFLHRYWRLTPLYAVVIMICGALFTHMITGPYQYLLNQPYFQFTQTVTECSNSWWANLLYINNFYPNYGSLSMTCADWTWYLANDMQFYIFLSPICILLLYKRRKLGVAVTTILILVCVAIRVFLVYYYGIHGLSGALTKHMDDTYAQHGAIYQRPYTRMGVYLVGTLTGYVLYRTQCRMMMHKVMVLAGWVVVISSGLAVIYGLYHYNHDHVTMNLAVSMVYTSVARCVWGACLAWLVIACASGYGGPVNQVLSWKIWAPLGRLSYAAYLVHPVLIYLFFLNFRVPIHFVELTMIYYFMATLMASYGVAFVVSMMVEAPKLQLEKLILGQ